MSRTDGNAPGAGGEIVRGERFLPQGQREERLAQRLQRGEVIAYRGLRDLGFSEGDVRGLVKRHHLRRIHRGVYASAHHKLSWRGQLKAALLAGGPTAFLSHHTAAHARGYVKRHRGPITITVIATSTPRIPGLRVHRISRPPTPGEVGSCDGLPTSTARRILLEHAADNSTDDELRHLAGEAIRQNALNLQRLPADIQNRPGAIQLQKALRGYTAEPRGRSGLEDAVAREIRRDPRFAGTKLERNVLLGTTSEGITLEADLLLKTPGGLILAAVETDGRAYHITIEDLEHDRIKDAWYARSGIPCLRITQARWQQNRPGCLGDLYAIVELSARSAA